MTEANIPKTVKLNIGDAEVLAIELRETIGQFTHWYVDKNQEPRYLILNESNQVPMIEELNTALASAQASGRFMIAVFTIVGDVVKGEQTLQLHRVSHEFPYEAFASAKTELSKNLDTEYTPPQPLKVADFVKQAIAEGGGGGVPFDAPQATVVGQNPLVAALAQMNQEVEQIEGEKEIPVSER